MGAVNGYFFSSKSSGISLLGFVLRQSFLSVPRVPLLLPLSNHDLDLKNEEISAYKGCDFNVKGEGSLPVF